MLDLFSDVALVYCFLLTLGILMDFPIHIGTISMGLPTVYF